MLEHHPFRVWRRANNLTLEECAGPLGVTFQHLGNIETGSRKPSVDLVAAMSRYTKDVVTRDEILRFHTEE